MRAWVVLGLLAAGCAHGRPPVGVLLAIDGVDGHAGLVGAGDAVEFRLENVQPHPHRSHERPEIVERLRALSQAGEIDQCITVASEAGLSMRALLAEDARDTAAAVLVFHAACLFSARAESAASRLLERAHILSLDVGPHLPETTGDFQSLAGRVGREMAERSRTEVQVSASRGRVSVDGGAQVCSTTPVACPFELLPGEHVFVASASGSSREIRITEVGEDASAVHLTLSAASSEESLAQFHEQLALRPLQIDESLARLAAASFEVPVALLLWSQANEMHAVVVDVEQEGLAGRGSAPGAREAARLAMATYSTEGGLPLWAVTLSVVAAVVAVGLAVALPVALVLQPQPEGRLLFTGTTGR